MRLRFPSPMDGYFGQIEFKNGVSVGLVSPNQANMMRALVAGIQILQDDGETVDEALMALSTILPLGYYIDAGIEPPSQFLTQWDGTYPAEVPEPVYGPAAVTTGTLSAPLQPGEYTRDYLEQLADKEGIAGLRVIGDQLSVKANSVVKLIESILDAQNAALNKTE